METLEGRALLASINYPGGGMLPLPRPSNPTVNPPGPAPTSPSMPMGTGAGHQRAAATGVVTKAPRFNPAYTGPKLAELNAVKASVQLSADGRTLNFTGTNQGRINRAPAVYVWGLDRSGNLGPGPFMNRPNIRFDAVVIVSLDSSLTPTAKVMDIANGVTTSLPAGSATIRGRTVSVAVPSSLLPSTGLAPSQYRFNYWPEDGGPPVSSSVASFLPEKTTAQVGTASP